MRPQELTHLDLVKALVNERHLGISTSHRILFLQRSLDSPFLNPDAALFLVPISNTILLGVLKPLERF